MSDPNIQTELDADGILLARIDMPGRAMNVFSKAMMDSLETLVVRAETDASVKAVVLTSGKTAFLAGADLEMIKMFTERASGDSTVELHALFGHLGRLFRRLELNPKPFVAAINGLALGGGLEVCLACHARVVADDPAIQLGLPEIKLGLLPGAGGTQRLPRLIGTSKGLQMLLTGDPVSPQEAVKLGLVQAAVPASELIETAKRRARELTQAQVQAPWDRPAAVFDSTPYDFSRPDAFAAIAKTVGISDYQLTHYPAYRAIMQCVVGGWRLPMTAASEHEMDIFVELMRDAVAGNMVRTLFLNRQKAAKLGLLGADSVLAQGDGALLPRMKAAIAKIDALGPDEKQRLIRLTCVALRCWADGKITQPDLADVAVVGAGLFPSYAGGPFTHAKQLGVNALRQQVMAMKEADVTETLPAIENFFARTEPAAA